MKKFLAILFSVFLTFCMALSCTACGGTSYCDPKGKTWYNSIAFPDISNPFNEIYDGSYAIQIDKKGNVTLKTLDGEVLEGKLSKVTHAKGLSTAIDIQFNNGNEASGYCQQDKYGRYLRFYYAGQSYSFSDKQQLSKEEMATYRAQFIEFLTNVYQTGVFPTEEEIKTNSLYQDFTSYVQIDPCCGGPFVYDEVEKVTIEAVTSVANGAGKELTIKTGERSVVCSVWTDISITAIQNGAFKKLSFEEIKMGECLVIPQRYYANGTETYDISGIFYFE